MNLREVAGMRQTFMQFEQREGFFQLSRLTSTATPIKDYPSRTNYAFYLALESGLTRWRPGGPSAMAIPSPKLRYLAIP